MNKKIAEYNLKAQVDYVNRLYREQAKLEYQYKVSFWFDYDAKVQWIVNDYKERLDATTDELNHAIKRMEILRQEYLRCIS